MQFHVYARALALLGVAALLGDGRRYQLIVETSKGDWGGTDYDVGYQIQGIQNGRQRHWPEGFWYFDNSKDNYEKGSVEKWSFDLPDDFHSINSLRVHHKYACCAVNEGWTPRRIQIKDSDGRVIDFADDYRNIGRDEVHTFYVDNCVVVQWTPWSRCSASCGKGTKTRELKAFAINAVCDTDKKSCVTADEWQRWSSCTVTCGGGKRTRYRQVNDDYKDKECEEKEVEVCGSEEC